LTVCDLLEVDTCEEGFASETDAAIARAGLVPPALAMREPNKADGPAIHDLVSSCSPLDLNSVYTYLLLGEHFSPTCVLAHVHDRLRGFVSAYVPPNRPQVLFVWQVAVHKRARGNSLGHRMLQHLVKRPALKQVKYIETTVGPDNKASRRMFGRLARTLQAPVRESQLFASDLFGAHDHDDEPLLRIGPFASR
jgi:L-2,4-diaminobutyric acid acetyltransferase